VTDESVPVHSRCFGCFGRWRTWRFPAVFLLLLLCSCRGTCAMHGDRLQNDVVPIVYGKPSLGRPYAEAREKLFPHANTFRAGGCEPQQATTARVRFCPECRKAFSEWMSRTPPEKR
jgi:hypothetical protein